MRLLGGPSCFIVLPTREDSTHLAASLPVEVTRVCFVNSVSPGFAPGVIAFHSTTKYFWVHYIVSGAGGKIVQQCFDSDVEEATKVLPLDSHPLRPPLLATDGAGLHYP